MISVIIPSRNERFLLQTVQDLLDKARGEIEIIVVLDGYWAELPADNRVRVIHRGTSFGMRQGINAAVAIAKGKYIMKIDAHCMVSEGYDLELIKNCDKDWVVIPRRKRLDAENWCIADVGKVDVDYEYLCFPNNPRDFGGRSLHGRIWTERIKDRLNKPEYDIDDNMSFQGSCWFMHRDYFYWLELMDYKNYTSFIHEAQEIGLKCLLSGGRLVTNKRVWYAHLHKGKKYGRMYNLDYDEFPAGSQYVNKWLTNSAWHKQTLGFGYIIEKYSPVPGWHDNWEQELGYTRLHKK